MANLPNLNSADISTIAWWDLGVPMIKSEILPILETYTEYDNGFDGTILLFCITGARSGSTSDTVIRVNVRGRTDGLLIAYALRANEDATNTLQDITSATSGHAAAIEANRRNLLTHTTTSTLKQFETYLANALNAMEDVLTSATKAQVVYANVSYYDFELPDVNTIYVRAKYSGMGVLATFTEPASGTTIHQITAIIVGSFATMKWNTLLNGSNLFNTASAMYGYRGRNIVAADLGSWLRAKTVANDLQADSGAVRLHALVLWTQE